MEVSSALTVADFPGTLVLPYQTTRRHKLEDSNVHENVMAHRLQKFPFMKHISHRILFSKEYCGLLQPRTIQDDKVCTIYEDRINFRLAAQSSDRKPFQMTRIFWFWLTKEHPGCLSVYLY